MVDENIEQTHLLKYEGFTGWYREFIVDLPRRLDYLNTENFSADKINERNIDLECR